MVSNNDNMGALSERLRRYAAGEGGVNENIVNILFDEILPGLRIREMIDRDYVYDLVKECGIQVLPVSMSDENLRVNISWWLSACKQLGILKPNRLCGQYNVQPDWKAKLEGALKGYKAAKA
jgi:hypothetical protein